MRGILMFLAAFVSFTSPAYAADILAGSVKVGPTSKTQLGRLIRLGVPQDFANDESFPGENNLTAAFAYTIIAVPFSANVKQDVFYDITFDDASTDLFISAYMNAYDPLNKSNNWLGDAGTSGNYFGVDALFFDVVVPKGNTLMLVINSAVGTGASSTANYFVQAFSDSEYSDNFAPGAVPELSTWAMMLVGFGAVGSAMRRRRGSVALMRARSHGMQIKL